MARAPASIQDAILLKERALAKLRVLQAGELERKLLPLIKYKPCRERPSPGCGTWRLEWRNVSPYVERTAAGRSFGPSWMPKWKPYSNPQRAVRSSMDSATRVR